MQQGDLDRSGMRPDASVTGPMEGNDMNRIGAVRLAQHGGRPRSAFP